MISGRLLLYFPVGHTPLSPSLPMKLGKFDFDANAFAHKATSSSCLCACVRGRERGYSPLWPILHVLCFQMWHVSLIIQFLKLKKKRLEAGKLLYTEELSEFCLFCQGYMSAPPSFFRQN